MYDRVVRRELPGYGLARYVEDTHEHGKRAAPPDQGVADRKDYLEQSLRVRPVVKPYRPQHDRPAPPGRSPGVGNDGGDLTRGIDVPVPRPHPCLYGVRGDGNERSDVDHGDVHDSGDPEPPRNGRSSPLRQRM